MSTPAPSVSLREPPPSRREALDGFTLFTLTITTLIAYFVSSLNLFVKRFLAAGGRPPAPPLSHTSGQGPTVRYETLRLPSRRSNNPFFKFFGVPRTFANFAAGEFAPSVARRFSKKVLAAGGRSPEAGRRRHAPPFFLNSP